MPSGLIALLDDVATIAKLAASTVDDVAGAAGKASTKAAGVVIDDTAVTPRYVTGLAPERELPIIGKIAWGSLKNKVLFLLPLAMLLTAFAPFLTTPLLMIGGAYLAFEATEKITEKLLHEHEHEEQLVDAMADPAELEKMQVKGAIRTDFILSAEIMAITLAAIPAGSFILQAVILAVVGIGITALVYGAVALIVKADDIGAAMARSGTGAARALGRILVVGMPRFLSLLSIVGTVAMLWVGGGILIHGVATFGWHAPEELIHDFAHTLSGVTGPLEAAATWLLTALASAVLGFAVGAAILGILSAVRRQPAQH